MKKQTDKNKEQREKEWKEKFRVHYSPTDTLLTLESFSFSSLKFMFILLFSPHLFKVLLKQHSSSCAACHHLCLSHWGHTSVQSLKESKDGSLVRFYRCLNQEKWLSQGHLVPAPKAGTQTAHASVKSQCLGQRHHFTNLNHDTIPSSVTHRCQGT